MSILDRYLARAVMGGAAMVLLVLLALAAFVGVVGEFGRIGAADYRLADALVYVLLGLPGQAFDFFPIAALIGSLLGLGSLASQNELTVMRAAGVSPWRIARGALQGGVLLMILCLALGEWIAPPAERYGGQMRAEALYDNVNLLGRDGAWLRDGNDYINARHAGPEGRLQQVRLYRFDEQRRLQEAITAQRAQLREGRWELEDVAVIHPAGERIRALREDRRTWESGIDEELLALVTVQPETLSAAGLMQYIRHLEANELDTDRHRMALWFKLVIPVAVPVMVLLAIPFLFGALRSAGAGQRLVVGMGIGIGFYLVNITLQNTGALLPVPPAVVAWAPTVLLAVASVVALRRI